jgi:hypothetical protein
MQECALMFNFLMLNTMAALKNICKGLDSSGQKDWMLVTYK